MHHKQAIPYLAAVFACLQSRGADPSLLTHDYDPYLNPGRKSVTDVALDDDDVRAALAAVNTKYEGEQQQQQQQQL